MQKFQSNPRACATHVLVRVIKQGRSLTQCLSELPAQQPELSFIKAVCFGTLRWYFRLQHVLSQLVPKPLKAKDIDISILLLIGLYQIIYLNTPAHAAVTETVAAARIINKPWATRLINGVLRTYLRHPENFLTAADNSLEGQYAHPLWFIKALQAAWPAHWQHILTANNQHPPLCLRVNTQQISRDDYLEILLVQGIQATPIAHLPAALILDVPQTLNLIPGFSNGQFSVQDAAAQLTVEFLDLAPGQRVLDACCAPGGKTLHILEKQPQLTELVAIDIDEERLAKAQANWQRLQLPQPVTWRVNDVCDSKNWWDGQLFDRILLDAPCSASGVIRRHPDIKLLRKLDDLNALAHQQTRLLETTWPLLKIGGRLLYTTCSIFPQENVEIVAYFLKHHPEAVEEKLVNAYGMAVEMGLQLLPGLNNMDGFYFACLIKTA